MADLPLTTCRLPVETGTLGLTVLHSDLIGGMEQFGLLLVAEDPEGFVREDQLNCQVLIIDGEFELDEFTEPFTGNPDEGLAYFRDIFPHDILLFSNKWRAKTDALYFCFQ
jgi:hypothetical protein